MQYLILHLMGVIITDREESICGYKFTYHSIPPMNSRATNITSYMHVCTTAITMQMVVNFIIDLENNVRTKNFRADREIIGPGGPKFSAKILVRDQIFQDQNSSDMPRMQRMLPKSFIITSHTVADLIHQRRIQDFGRGGGGGGSNNYSHKWEWVRAFLLL